jgi:hypothetical protein
MQHLSNYLGLACVKRTNPVCRQLCSPVSDQAIVQRTDGDGELKPDGITQHLVESRRASVGELNCESVPGPSGRHAAHRTAGTCASQYVVAVAWPCVSHWSMTVHYDIAVYCIEQNLFIANQGPSVGSGHCLT